MRKLDRVGWTIGPFTMLEDTGVKRTDGTVYRYQCGLCGSTSQRASWSNFKRMKSCGCQRVKVGLAHPNARHGHACRNSTGDTRTYRSWMAMKRRCGNPAHDAYPRYGGRGITYEERWNSFHLFLADMGERPFGKELGRLDDNGPYCKDNCRWMTHQENCKLKGYDVSKAR